MKYLPLLFLIGCATSQPVLLHVSDDPPDATVIEHDGDELPPEPKQPEEPNETASGIYEIPIQPFNRDQVDVVGEAADRYCQSFNGGRSHIRIIHRGNSFAMRFFCAK